MNKIVLSSGVNELEKFVDTTDIIVLRESTLNIVNYGQSLHLNIEIKENAFLILNIFDIAVRKEIVIDITSYDNSKFTLNVGFISEEKYTLKVNTNLFGNNIINDVNIRGINENKSTVNIIMNGTVVGKTVNNVINEYAKIINKSDASNIMIPNLIVNTNDVVANHGVSIGGFRSDELFYLASKGIDTENSKKMIEEGFILSIMDESLLERIKNILIGR